MATEIATVKPCERIMDNWAAVQLIDWASGRKGTQQTKDSIRGELSGFIAGLAGPSPTPTERVLAETAGLAWLSLRLHEARYAGASASTDPMSFAQSEHAQGQIDRAHRRLLSAIKTLETVRRLARPAVQINLARNQVNLAASQ